MDVQSLWVAAHVKAINPDAVLFPTELALREPFYGVPEWQYPEHHTLFCTSAAHPPYKGLHVAVRALALLKKRIPDVRLRMAGSHQRPGLRQDGYMRWLNGLILKLDLATAITWLGPLQAGQIVVELMQASAVVVPTFIENCCTAMQEGMAVGTPVVASYAGGIPSLGRDEESCLFFSPGDAAMCARQLERLLTDRELSMRLSRASRGLSALRNDKQRIVQRQLNIYEEVINRQEQER